MASAPSPLARSNLLPYVLVTRSCFIYHYMPALMYGEIMTALLVDKLAGRKFMPLACKVILAVVLAVAVRVATAGMVAAAVAVAQVAAAFAAAAAAVTPTALAPAVALAVLLVLLVLLVLVAMRKRRTMACTPAARNWSGAQVCP